MAHLHTRQTAEIATCMQKGGPTTFAPRELHALGGQLFAGVIIFPVHREMFRVYLKSLPTTYGSRSDTQTATQIIDDRVNARVNTAAQK